jgi:hypothetical protein
MSEAKFLSQRNLQANRALSDFRSVEMFSIRLPKGSQFLSILLTEKIANKDF